MMGHGYHRRFGRSRGWSPGVVLVALGAGFLLLHLLAASGALPLLVLGGVFTALSQRGRGGRGFLVPGGILLGLGAGIVLASVLGRLTGALGGAAVVGGLGAGFWFMFLLDQLRHPLRPAFGWARVPGSILLGVAALLASLGVVALTGQVVWNLLAWWPVLLIVGGLWLFLSNRRARRGS